MRYFESEFIKSFKKVNVIFLWNRMSSVCHSYVLVFHPYVTCLYSYVIRISLLCTRMSSVRHLYVPQLVRGVIPPLFQVTRPPSLTRFPPFQNSKMSPPSIGLSEKQVLNDSFNQFLYKFYPQSILILEEYLLKL